MQFPRSFVFAALSATLLVSLLFGTAYVACGPDGKRCAKTQTFLESPAKTVKVEVDVESPSKMEVNVIEGVAAHLHHGHHEEGLPTIPDIKEWWKRLQEKMHKRRDPRSIWGDIPEDNRTDPENIHCGEMMIPVDEKIANGEWPINEVLPESRNGKATLCEGGKADPGTGTLFDCNNVDLQSFVPLSDFFGSLKANDVWAWADNVTGKEYAIIGLGEGTGFVDITVPTEPVVVGVMPTATSSSTWRDIKVYGNKAYVVSEAWGHGLQVFDLTRLRGRTTPPTTNDQPDARSRDFGSAHNIVINNATGRAFVVGGRSAWGFGSKCSGGLAIYDIRDPDATKEPPFEGCFSSDGYTHDAECVIYRGPDAAYEGKEICVAYNENSLTIVDVSRTADGGWQAPTLISRTPYDGSQYTHQGWLDEQHEFAYMNDELDEERDRNDKRTRTYIFDVRDLASPVLHDIYWHTTDSIDHNNYILNGYVYQGNYCAGLRILKIQEDHKLEEVAYFDTEPQCDQAIFEGVWSVYPWLPSGTIVVSSVERGLFVFKANLPPK